MSGVYPFAELPTHIKPAQTHRERQQEREITWRSHSQKKVWWKWQWAFSVPVQLLLANNQKVKQTFFCHLRSFLRYFLAFSYIF